MTAAKHTAEPWPTPVFDSAAGRSAGYCLEWYEIEGVARFERGADALRARECVNACEGLRNVELLGQLLQAADDALNCLERIPRPEFTEVVVRLRELIVKIEPR